MDLNTLQKSQKWKHMTEAIETHSLKADKLLKDGLIKNTYIK